VTAVRRPADATFIEQREIHQTQKGHETGMKLSARNQINARVVGITRGEATANVELDAGGTRLVASITVEAASELGLAAGQQVIAVVKASDVILAVAD